MKVRMVERTCLFLRFFFSFCLILFRADLWFAKLHLRVFRHDYWIYGKHILITVGMDMSREK